MPPLKFPARKIPKPSQCGASASETDLKSRAMCSGVIENSFQVSPIRSGKDTAVKLISSEFGIAMRAEPLHTLDSTVKSTWAGAGLEPVTPVPPKIDK